MGGSEKVSGIRASVEKVSRREIIGTGVLGALGLVVAPFTTATATRSGPKGPEPKPTTLRAGQTIITGVGAAAVGKLIDTAISNSKKKQFAETIKAELRTAAERPYETVKSSIFNGEFNLEQLLQLLHNDQFINYYKDLKIDSEIRESILKAVRDALVISGSIGNYAAMRQILDRSDQGVDGVRAEGLKRVWDIPRKDLINIYRNLARSRERVNPIDGSEITQDSVMAETLRYIAIQTAKRTFERGEVSTADYRKVAELIVEILTAQPDIKLQFAEGINLEGYETKDDKGFPCDGPRKEQILSDIAFLNSDNKVEILNSAETALLKTGKYSNLNAQTVPFEPDPSDGNRTISKPCILVTCSRTNLLPLEGRTQEIHTYRFNQDGLKKCQEYLAENHSLDQTSEADLTAITKA